MQLTHRPMTKREAELLLKLNFVANEGNDIDITIDDMPFVSQIIHKRIEVFNLPIKFTPVALMSIGCFANVAGEAVVLLMDALAKFENKTVTLDMLAMELYPMGFYDQKSFEWLLDNKVKTGQMKWSEIY